MLHSNESVHKNIFLYRFAISNYGNAKYIMLQF